MWPMVNMVIKWLKAKEYYKTLDKLMNLDEMLKQEEVNGSIYVYSPYLNEFLYLNISPERTRKLLKELKPELEKELQNIEDEMFEMLKSEKECEESFKSSKPWEDDEFIAAMIDEVVLDEVQNDEN